MQKVRANLALIKWKLYKTSFKYEYLISLQKNPFSYDSG